MLPTTMSRTAMPTITCITTPTGTGIATLTGAAIATPTATVTIPARPWSAQSSAPPLIPMAATHITTGHGDTARARPMIGADITGPRTEASPMATARASTIAMGSTTTTDLALITGSALTAAGRDSSAETLATWAGLAAATWAASAATWAEAATSSAELATPTRYGDGRLIEPPLSFNGTISHKVRRTPRPPSQDAAIGRRTPSRRHRGPSSRLFQRSRTVCRDGWRRGRPDAAFAGSGSPTRQ